MGQSQTYHLDPDPRAAGLRVEGSEVRQTGWTLNFETSIYDQGLLTPMIRGPWRTWLPGYICLMMSITLVLCVNVGLQFVVVDKIIDMAYEKRYELEYKLFGEPGRVGMCVIREKDELPYVSRLNPEDIPDRLLGCTSTSISILSNVTVLDTNNDGSWTEEEASALGQIWEEKYKKNSVLVQLFRSLQRLAQEERLLAQLAAGSDADATLGDATDSLPMPWMEMEKEKLLLCALVEPKLCSNLEVRGILPEFAKTAFPSAVTAADRIAACSITLQDYCVDAFGQLYKYYQDFTSTVCGPATYVWDNHVDIMITEFTVWVDYVGGLQSQRDSVVSSFYQVFLCLILLVWWMIMLTEVRTIIDWMVVIAFINSSRDVNRDPPSESRESPYVDGFNKDQLDSDIFIYAIPLHWKAYALVFHVIPRAYIWLRLSFYGSWFLISADSYQDLILNSVALAFLVEVDNLLYDAVMAKRDKDVHERVQPIIVLNDWFWPFYYIRHKLPTQLVLMLGVLIVGTIFTGMAFLGPHGKISVADALNCVCQVEGNNCIGAQLLGGNSSVMSSLGYSGDPVPRVDSTVSLWERVREVVLPDIRSLFDSSTR